MAHVLIGEEYFDSLLEIDDEDVAAFIRIQIVAAKKKDKKKMESSQQSNNKDSIR